MFRYVGGVTCGKCRDGWDTTRPVLPVHDVSRALTTKTQIRAGLFASDMKIARQVGCRKVFQLRHRSMSCVPVQSLSSGCSQKINPKQLLRVVFGAQHFVLSTPEDNQACCQLFVAFSLHIFSSTPHCARIDPFVLCKGPRNLRDEFLRFHTILELQVKSQKKKSRRMTSPQSTPHKSCTSTRTSTFAV